MSSANEAAASVVLEPCGKLFPRNIVSTYYARVMNTHESNDINLPIVAIITCGKYNRGVFPAVVSKARLAVHGAVETQPVPDWMTYPLMSRMRTMTSKSKSKKKASKLLESEDTEAKPVRNTNYITVTDSIFRSGQNVVAGGTSVLANMLIAYTYVRRLCHDTGLEIRVCNFSTQNIVCSAVLGYELNPDWIAQEAEKRGWEVYYNPEEFIGLSWMTENPKIVFVVFSTGKIVATGIKAMHEIEIAEKRMMQLIAPFRKGQEPASYDASNTRMRSATILSTLKEKVKSEAAAAKQRGVHTKDNAAKRNIKKLNNEVKMLMRTMDVSAIENGDFTSVNYGLNLGGS